MRTTHPALLVAAFVVTGCASRRDGLAREVIALRAEVSELRATGQTRAEALERLQNRVYILEGGADPAPVDGVSRGERALPVVAIAPGKSGDQEEGGEVEDHEPVEGDLPEVHFRKRGRGTARRPNLSLVGGTTARRVPFVAPPAPAGAPHETLGVVPLAGLPASAQAAGVAGGGASYDQAATLVRARRYDEAVTVLRRVLDADPSGAGSPAAHFLLGECHAARGRHLEAIGELERLQRRHPGHRPAEVLLKMGQSYAALGDRDRARDLFFQIVERHPGTPAARDATARAASFGQPSGEARP